MRALIVCDNPWVSDKIRVLVERCGFECRPSDVVSLRSAVVQAGRARRELTILVMTLHVEQGLAVLGELRSTSPTALVVVGPADDPKLILRVMREGADEYLDDSDFEEELGASLPKLRAKRSPRKTDHGHIVGVLAPSGGSGGTMLAVNLAAALAQQHKSSGLFDLRMSACDQTLMLDLSPKYNTADLCRNCDRMDQSMLQQALVRHESGVFLLAAPTSLEDWAHVRPQGVRRALGIFRSLFPFVVLDLDRSLGAEQLAAIMQLDLILLVLRLDMMSLRNTQRILDHLNEMGVVDSQIRVVVNRHGQRRELSARSVEKSLGMDLVHYIPNDPATVNFSINRGVPLVVGRRRSKVAQSIHRLASRVTAFCQDHRAHSDHHNQNGQGSQKWSSAALVSE